MRVEADLSNSHSESQLHLESWCNRNALRLYIHFIFLQFSWLKINPFWKVKVDMWQWPLWISPGTQTLLPINGSIVVLPNAPQRRHLLSPRLPGVKTIDKCSRRKLPVHCLHQFCLFLWELFNKRGDQTSLFGMLEILRRQTDFECGLARQKCQGHSALPRQSERLSLKFLMSAERCRDGLTKVIRTMLLGQTFILWACYLNLQRKRNL